jgi:branched-chain amino acid transport system substrate-binding protein
MRLKHQWWSRLVASLLGGLVGVTAVAAAGEQFLPVLVTREGAQRALHSLLANGFIAYLTLLNERDGGINGVPVVWEECETVYDVDRGIECYERLKAKGATGAAVFPLADTPIVNALIARATHDQIPLLAVGVGRSDAAEGRVFPYVFTPPHTWWSENTAKDQKLNNLANGGVTWQDPIVPLRKFIIKDDPHLLFESGSDFPSCCVDLVENANSDF